MSDQTALTSFETQRRFLFGLAYRLLGGVAEAEDAVQDTWIKWQGADILAIDNPAAWLTAACTRHCLNILQSSARSRTEYVGVWLPEPIDTGGMDTPEDLVELASSLSTAFVLMLQRLSPKERAAFLLRDIFDQDYAAVANALSLDETACRKLVSRARTHIGRPDHRYNVPQPRQKALLSAFQTAVTTGETARLTALLSSDIVLAADGGGKVATIEATIAGREPVLRFLTDRLREWWRSYRWEITSINGALGAVVSDGSGVTAIVSFSCNEAGEVCGIYIMRNPEKFTHFRAGRTRKPRQKT